MTEAQSQAPRGRSFRSRAIWLAILLSVVAYAVFRPALERRWGVALPTVPLGAEPETADRSSPPHGGDDLPSDAPPASQASVPPGKDGPGRRGGAGI